MSLRTILGNGCHRRREKKEERGPYDTSRTPVRISDNVHYPPKCINHHLSCTELAMCIYAALSVHVWRILLSQRVPVHDYEPDLHKLIDSYHTAEGLPEQILSILLWHLTNYNVDGGEYIMHALGKLCGMELSSDPARILRSTFLNLATNPVLRDSMQGILKTNARCSMHGDEERVEMFSLLEIPGFVLRDDNGHRESISSAFKRYESDLPMASKCEVPSFRACPSPVAVLRTFIHLPKVLWLHLAQGHDPVPVKLDDFLELRALTEPEVKRYALRACISQRRLPDRFEYVAWTKYGFHWHRHAQDDHSQTRPFDLQTDEFPYIVVYEMLTETTLG